VSCPWESPAKVPPSFVILRVFYCALGCQSPTGDSERKSTVALLTRSAVRNYARTKTANFSTKSASNLLNENVKTASASTKTFDIFLSHRYADKEELVGLLTLLEDAGLSVLVDWREHPELDRKKVTRDTAATLRADMKRCRTLLFAVTTNAASSVWMPWELGLFDGMNGRVATVPLSAGSTDFPGQEYAELYPWVDEAHAKGQSQATLWVNESDDTYIQLTKWIQGGNPTKHT
jgi:hypothetical protein